MAYSNLISRTDAAGMIPVAYSNELVNRVQAQQSVVMGFARRLRDMTVYQQKMPVISARATANFRTKDTGLVQTTEINWEDVTCYAEEIDAMAVVPQTVIDDNSEPIWELVRPDLEEAIGAAVDNAILWGTNKPSTWPTALITAAASASHGVTIGTGADLYEDILMENGVFAQVETDGFAVTGCIMDLTMKGKLRGVRDANGIPIFNRNPEIQSGYDLDGVPAVFPMNGSGSSSYPLVAGDWRHLAYAVREGIDYAVSTEGVINDAAGNIVFNLWQQRMAAIMITFSVGFVVSNDANRVNTSSTTRYPFSYLAA